jgi:hypothetical protein
VWEQEGLLVRRRRQYWFITTWSLWIILAGGASVLACMSHPAAHAGAHPLLCMDPDNPVVQGNNDPTLLVEGRRLRSPCKFLISVLHPAAVGVNFTLILYLPAHELSWALESISSPTPASFQPVLRL